ncbi:MAG: hypothetical protein GTO02_13775 [Candidatus Dadabacteria bacterium]|nr:hypothetical protein [Candidatus Dadabacteria bacterium]
MQGAPKFSKVEIIFIEPVDNIDPSKIGSKTNKVSFDDVGMVITGDYIILVLDEKSDMDNPKSSTGYIYPISNIKSYTTHAK